MDRNDKYKALPPGIVIRPTTTEDADAICAVIAGVANERQYIALQGPPNRERFQRFVADGIVANNAQYVALEQVEVVGWCDITRMQRDVFAHRAVVGMGVAARWRGRGIGRALLTTAIREARSRGISRVELEVRADNSAAIALYASTGFQTEGDMPDALRAAGTSVTLKRMALLF